MNKIAGWVSLVLGLLLLITMILMIASLIPPAGNLVTTLLMIFGFFYASYKTLYKKGDLSKSEWAALVILIILFFLPMLLL